jgi:polyhydroxyalkanoate synthesis regulator phasin
MGNSPVALDFTKAQPIQTAPSQPAQQSSAQPTAPNSNEGVSLDFSQAQPVTVGDIAQPTHILHQGVVHQLAAPSGPTTMSAAPKSTGMANSLENWFRDAADDIRNGSDKTEIGSILKKMGAQGTSGGASGHTLGDDYSENKAGDFVASPALGLSRVGQGAAELGQHGKRWQGTKDVVGGALDAAQIPLAVTAGPEAGEAAAKGAGKAATAVGETAGKVADAVKHAIPSTERAGRVMEDLKTAIGSHPVELTDEVSKAASRIQELADNGNVMPSAARKFLNRVTDPSKGHLTYNEARDFLTKFGSMTADEATKLSPAVKGQLQQLGGALRDAVEATAKRGGKLEEFQTSMKEYASSKKLQEVAQFLKDKAISAGATAAIGGAAYETYQKLKDMLE